MKNKKFLTWNEFVHEESENKKKNMDLTPISLSKITTIKLTFKHKITAKDVVEIEDVKSEKRGCNIL